MRVRRRFDRVCAGGAAVFVGLLAASPGACTLPDRVVVSGDAAVDLLDVAAADVAEDRRRPVRRCDGGVCPPDEVCAGDQGGEAMTPDGCLAANASRTDACGARQELCAGTCLRCACHAEAPRVLWLRGYNDEDVTQQRQAAKGTAIDDDGSIYLIGRFSGVLRDTMGFSSIRYAGPQTYVAAYAPDGARRWFHVLGAGTANLTNNMILEREGYSVTVAADGDLYVAGPLMTTATVPTGGKALTVQAADGARDVFIARVSRELGHARWVRALGATGDARAGQLAVASDGMYVVAGSVRATPTWGEPGARVDAFVRAYAADGTLAWSWRPSGEGDERVHGVAVGETTVVAVGEFTGTVDLGDGVRRSVGTTVLRATPGPTTAFIVSFERATGELRWARALGDSTDQFMAVGLDAAQNAYVGATIGSQFPFGGVTVSAPVTTGNPLNVAVLSYGVDGCERWARAFGGNENDGIMALAVSPEGTVYAGGSSCRSFSFGEGVAPGGGCVSSFLVSYDRAGELRWGRRYGTRADNRNESVYGIAVNRSGRIAACGATASPDPGTFRLNTFPGGALVAAGETGYLLALEP